MDRILIVEDDSSIRKALSMGLAAKKYKVDSAQDGCTGIHKAAENRYDILITDLCLSDYNGIEVIRKIKIYNPEIISIIITGRGTLESSIQAIRLGVTDYFEKPVSLKDIENVIVQGLKKRSLRQKEIQKNLMQQCLETAAF